MAEINVSTVNAGEEEWTFEVIVAGDTRSQHRVSMRRLDYERLTGATTKVGQMGGPEAFIRTTFEFLLKREPQGSILREFDVMVIPRYFPEYEQEVMKKYGAGSSQ